jgi:hypothetical protein
VSLGAMASAPVAYSLGSSEPSPWSGSGAIQQPFQTSGEWSLWGGDLPTPLSRGLLQRKGQSILRSEIVWEGASVNWTFQTL